MLTEGLIIMFIGMATVFIFLAILVSIMYASRYFVKYLPIENQSFSEEISSSQDATPEDNFLLMHAMGPNVAGVIGSAAAAGVLLSLLS